MLLDHARPHVVLDQPPDVVDIGDELRRALDRKRARTRQGHGDRFLDAAGAARQHENAMIGPEVAGRAGPTEKRRTRDLLKLVGLAGFEDYYPRQLSGGMRQRVNLARALAIDPQILLMDEPFSALDAQTREIMQTELLRIWDEGRKTVLFVTHQIDEAVFLSDRVLVLARRPGRIQETVTVTLPRPRTLAVKRTPEFVAYVDHIWRLIEDDVRASVIEEHA